MAKRSKPPKVPANPEPETQQKDDRASTKDLVALTTAIIQLFVAILTLIIILIKDK